MKRLKRRHPHHKLIISILVLSIVTLVLVPFFRDHYQVKTDFSELDKNLRYAIQERLGMEVERADGYWNDIEFTHASKNYNVELTIDANWQQFLIDLIEKHQSDYTSIVIVDNNNGRILAAVDHEKQRNKFGKKISFSSTSPAASIIKVVTAADLIESDAITLDDEFTFTGRPYTLYRRQLEAGDNNKWANKLTFKRAFEASNNVVFGRAAIKYTDELRLYQTAQKFDFNESIIREFSAGKSYFPLPRDSYNLAELASGLNRTTLMSPAHGAKIAMIIANDGYKLPLSIVKTVREQDRILYENKEALTSHQVLTSEAATQLQDLMESVVFNGTARSVGKALSTTMKNDLMIGAKSGSMTGGLPYGKRDWLVSYIIPRYPNLSEQGDDFIADKGISVAVMLINKDKWYTKSTVLTQKIIKHYYQIYQRNEIEDSVDLKLAAPER